MPRASETQAKVRRALARPDAIPTQLEFAEEMVRLAGGPKRLARAMWTELHNDKCPPSVKAKIWEFVIKTLKTVNRDTKPDDESALSDDELVAFIQYAVTELGEGKAGGEVQV